MYTTAVRALISLQIINQASISKSLDNIWNTDVVITEKGGTNLWHVIRSLPGVKKKTSLSDPPYISTQHIP